METFSYEKGKLEKSDDRDPSKEKRRQSYKSCFACFNCKKKWHKIAECRKCQRDEEETKNILADKPRALTFGKKNIRSSTCLIDSGAIGKKRNRKSIDVTTVEGYNFKASYSVTFDIFFNNDFGHYTVKLRNVLYNPTSSMNLLYVSQAAMRG